MALNDSIALDAPILVGQQKATDAKYDNGGEPMGYTSIAQAKSILTIGLRYQGLTIKINGIEYWWEPSDTDLTKDPIIKNLPSAAFPDGVISGGEIDVSDFASGNITVSPAQWLLTVSGTQQVYGKVTSTLFTGIGLSSSGNQRYVAFYGYNDNNILKLEGAESPAAVMPSTPPDTVLIGYTLITDSQVLPPVVDLSGYVKYSDIATDTDLQTQTTPLEDKKIVSRHGLIYFWNWVKNQVINFGVKPTVNGTPILITTDINQESFNYEEQGVIINDDFNRGSVGSNWTNTGGGTFGISSNRLSVDGGSTLSLTRLLIWNAYGNSNLESFTLSATITVGTISATSFGVGFSMESNSAASFKSNLKIHISLNTGDLGFIYFNQTGSGGSYTSKSPKGINISSGDVLKFTNKFIKNKFIVTVINQNNNELNQFELEIAATSPYTFLTPNSYRHAIMAVGGLHYIDDYQVYSNDLKKVPFLTLGDSIAKGLTTSYIGYRYTELLNNLTDTATQTNAGGGNVVADINVNEVLALQPQKILIHIGTNDIALGGGIAVAQANYTTLVNTLVSNGYAVGASLFFVYLLPRNLSDIAVFNSWLLSTYGESAVINVYDSLSNGIALNTSYTLDNVHPNEIGHKIIANIILNKLSLKSRPRKQGNYYPLVYTDDKIGVASKKFRGALSYNTLDVIDESGTQINVRNVNSRGGGYIGSLNGTSSFIAGGAEYVSGWVARAAQASIMLMFNGDLYFYRNTGLTAGNAFSPTLVASCIGGSWQFGGTATPNTAAALEVQSTTKGFLLPRMTTAQFAAISSKPAGLQAYDTTTNRPTVYNGSVVKQVAYTDDMPNIVSNAATLSISSQGNYTFNGTTSTWTLPTLASSVGFRIIIMNQGSGTLTVNTNAGANDIYNGMNVNSVTVNPSEVCILYNNSISFFRQL